LICTANYRNMNVLIGYLVDECCADAGCVKRPEVAAV
jgi:ArsR family transcriptional regulator